MSDSSKQAEDLTLGQLAKRLGIDLWKVQRVAASGSIKFKRIGHLRVVSTRDMPAIIEALRQAGYFNGSVESRQGFESLA